MPWLLLFHLAPICCTASSLSSFSLSSLLTSDRQRQADQGARDKKKLTLRLRTVFIFVPQPVAACLRVLPAARRCPELASILLPDHPPSACSYLAAKWQFDVSHTPSASFTRWHMTRLTCGLLLLEACRQGCVPVNILDHLQIPQFRLVAQISSLSWARPANAHSPSSLLTQCWRTCIALAGALNWCSKCLESGRSRLLLRSHLRYVSRMILRAWGVSVGRGC